MSILDKRFKRKDQVSNKLYNEALKPVLTQILFSKHWKDKARSRPELREYIATSWKDEIEML